MKISFGKKLLAVLTFWVLVIFGGAVVMLWNAISPAMAQYRPGDLGYLILQIVGTGIGAVLAVWAADSITNGMCKVLCMVNCTIAATFFSTVIGLNVLLGGYSVKDILGVGLAVAVLIYAAHSFSRDIGGDLAKECKVLQDKQKEAEPVMELFTQFAKAAGMTVPEYTRHIRIQAKMATGMSEREAEAAIAQEDLERKDK